MATLDDLRQLIDADREMGGHTYPDQAAQILNDERLVELLSHRFERGDQLTGIYEMDYQVSLGLIPIVLEFGSNKGSVATVNDILVLVSGDCRIAAVHEGFNRLQPNPMYPPQRYGDRPPYVQGNLPYVVARPSVTLGLPDPSDALLSYQDRIRQFLDRLGLREISAPAGKNSPCTVGTDVYSADGVWDTRADRIADDCE